MAFASMIMSQDEKSVASVGDAACICYSWCCKRINWPRWLILRSNTLDGAIVLLQRAMMGCIMILVSAILGCVVCGIIMQSFCMQSTFLGMQWDLVFTC